MHAGPRWVLGHHRIFTFSVGKSGETLKKEVKKSKKIAENSIGPCHLNPHSHHQMEMPRMSSEMNLTRKGKPRAKAELG